MMRIAVVLLVALTTSSGAYSHHGIPNNANLSSQTLISGSIEFVEWTNPHVLIHIKSIPGDELEQRWIVIADSPNDLLSRGLSRALLDVMGEARFTIYASSVQPCITECMGFGYNLIDSFGRVFVLHQELYETANQLSLGN